MKNKVLLLCLLFGLRAGAQKEVSTVAQTWVGYIQQARLSQRWGLTADVHFRTDHDWLRGRNLSLGRIGGTYFLSDQVQLTAGYTHFHYYPAEQHPEDARPEHRLWQQVVRTENGPKLRVQQRLRIEQRWRKHITPDRNIGDGFDFNWRLRMQVQLLYPIRKKGYEPRSIAFMLAAEPMLNFRKEIVYNTFDQNRTVVGVQIQLAKSSSLQVGYMHIFQQQTSGFKYKQSHVARIFYTHVLDLREHQAKKRHE